MNIILADDSEIIRTRLRDLLRDIPDITVVAEATTALEAHALAHQHQPEVMLMNFQLPGESGLETLRKIKELSSPPCIIILTNNISPEYVRSCRSAGADHIFDKAIDIEKIQTVLRDLISL